MKPYYSEINRLKEDLAMKMPQISLLEWQKKYGTEKACADAIAKYRCPMALCAPDAVMIPPGSPNRAKYISARTVKPRFPWLPEPCSIRPICLWLSGFGLFILSLRTKGEYLPWGFLSNLEFPGRQREIYLKKSGLRWRTVTAYTACRIL